MARRRASAPRELDAGDYRLLADFRRLLRQFLAFSEQSAAKAGLAPQQHQALLAIKGHRDGAPTVGDLARHLVIRHHSAVGLVDRLVRAGYVVRRGDPADKRRVTLVLTKKGQAVLKQLTVWHRAELRRLAPLLKPLLARLQD